MRRRRSKIDKEKDGRLKEKEDKNSRKSETGTKEKLTSENE